MGDSTQARLVYRSTHGRIVMMPLSASGVTIGRDPGCEIQVGDLLISGRHCRVAQEHDGWVVTDLGSANHTFINDGAEPAARAQLKNRDVIRCGSLWLQFLTGEQPTPPRPPPLPTADTEGAELALCSVRTALEVAQHQQEKLVAELSSLREEIVREKENGRVLREKLQAEEQVSAGLRAELAMAQEQLTTANHNARLLDSQREADAARLSVADSKLKQSTQAQSKLEEQLRHLRDDHALLYEQSKELQKKASLYEAVCREKDDFVKAARDTSAEHLKLLQELQLKLNAQAAELAQKESELNALRAQG